MIHDTGASINNEPSRDTESEREPETETETETASHSITDADVVEALQKGIREAARDNVSEELINEGEASLYYDSLTMSPLNAMSAAAIARFRAYKPPAFPLWDRLPVRRRAAVLILLYADRRGDLRVVITMRAASLRNFSGHAAFPGGKADDAQETPFQIARREAWEEIGLPMDDSKLPKPFRVEHLCYLPPSLARTHLVVRPCVAFLHADQRTAGEPAPTVDETMIPRLDAREVAAVFSAPFYNFLQANDLPPGPGEVLPEGRWYDGFWHSWKDHRWRVHNFYVPVNNQSISKPRKDSEQSQLVEKLEKEEEADGRFKVWGMTARILVDAARIAYAQEPGFEHNDNIGDEDIIAHADSLGELGEKVQDKPQEKKTESGEAAKM